MEILADAATARIAQMRATFAQMTGRENGPDDNLIPESRMALETDYPPVSDEPDYEPDTYYTPADREAFADAAEDRWLNSL